MEGKNCNGYKWIIIILLLINTFFIGSIWCKIVIQCGGKSWCPISKEKSIKMCPITGQPLTQSAPMAGE